MVSDTFLKAHNFMPIALFFSNLLSSTESGPILNTQSSGSNFSKMLMIQVEAPKPMQIPH